MKKLMTVDHGNQPVPEKITGTDIFGDTYPSCEEVCKNHRCKDRPIQEVFTRLKEYEDTRLSPKQVRKLKRKVKHDGTHERK